MTTCFVLMPFGAPFDSYYRAVFAPAIDRAGFMPVRSDDVAKPGAIIDQIWKGINAAEVCLADLTGCNPNVMYELGLVHALGKPVLQLVQNTRDLPFDLQHLRHITYRTTASDWQGRLQDEIVRVLAALRDDPSPAVLLSPGARIPSGRYAVYRRSFHAEERFETLAVRVGDHQVTVASVPSEWSSIGSLVRGNRYVGRFQYQRGSTSCDRGTHDLTWNGREFTGWAPFDDGQCDPIPLIWRPERPAGRFSVADASGS
jgi:hypothetical protein